MRADDRIDRPDLGGGIAREQAMLQLAAGLDMVEGAVVAVEILAFLAEREAQQDFARPRQPALTDQRLHLLDMVTIGGLDAQVGTQIMGKTIVAVARDRCIAVRLGICQRADHSFRGGEIEQILRHAGPGSDCAPKQVPGPMLQPEQTEHRADRIERFGRRADGFCGTLRNFGGLTGLAGEKMTLCAQHERDGISGDERDRAIGADNRGIVPATQQRGFSQQRPGSPVARIAGDDLRADPLGRRKIAAGKGAARCLYCRCCRCVSPMRRGCFQRGWLHDEGRMVIRPSMRV